MPTVSMTVNGGVVSHEVKNHTLLVEFIRETLALTGTRVGCDTSQCGTCTIHVNNMSVKACTMLALQAEGAEILTIEGVANEKMLHPMQQAFTQNHGLQCGFCTPGMIMTALALIKENPNPTKEEVRLELDGNLCRCTGYKNIIKAILEGAKAMRGQ